MNVKINKQEYPFRFSYKALKAFMEKRKKDFNTMDEMGIEDIAWVGVLGIQSAGGEIDIEKMEDLLDADMSGIKAITDAMAYEMESFTGDGKKKKAG